MLQKNKKWSLKTQGQHFNQTYIQGIQNMDALTEILEMSPIAIQHVHLTRDENGHVVMSCEIADIDQGLTVEQAGLVEHMLKQLINMACTSLNHDYALKKISIEMAYSSYDEWLDAVGTIICVERTMDGKQLKIERYDPTLMDTITTYRNAYEHDLVCSMHAIQI